MDRSAVILRRIVLALHRKTGPADWATNGAGPDFRVYQVLMLFQLRAAATRAATILRQFAIAPRRIGRCFIGWLRIHVGGFVC